MKSKKQRFESYDDVLFENRGQIRSPLSERKSTSAPEASQGPKTELLIGSTFAERYQVLEMLGKGGMGKVYKVLDKEINEVIAIKLLNSEIAHDEETLERFRNELKLARQISHRNVCRMFDLRKDGGNYYIAMEYVAGEDLKSSIRRIGPLSPGKTVYVAMQICQGLAEAHMLGIVHCDLKPQNIMIDAEGNVRIVDFGVARSLRAKGMTETGMMIGTPEYMSVEQVEGKKVDQRSDIYSLGVILYEMVTGKVPFRADTPLSTALKHTTDVPLDPRDVKPEIPEDLGHVILRCLERDMERRYQSAEELLEELRRMEKDMPSTEVLPFKRRSSALGRVNLTFPPKRLLIPLLAGIAILLIGILIRQFLSRTEVLPTTTAKPSLVILPFDTDARDQSLDSWGPAISQLFTADLRQSKFIRVLGAEQTSNILTKLDLPGAGTYSSEDLQKVATQAGVDHVLTGCFSKADDGFKIITKVQKEPTGLVVSSRAAECTEEKGIPGKVDELTEKIKLDLGLTPAQASKDNDMDVEDIVTSSPKAYGYYAQGWQNHTQRGEPRQTIKLMHQAIEEDPEFALAYGTMANAYSELGLYSKMWNSLQKACELKHRLSRRDHLLIQGEHYSVSEETYDKAIESYERLLNDYPYDRDANLNLGLMFLYDLEQWDKAIGRFDILIQNKEVSSEPYIAQAEAYMAKGMYDPGREVLENFLTDHPEEIWLHQSIANIYLCQGKSDLALTEARKVLSENPFSVSPSLTGDIYHCSGDLINAEKEYQTMLNNQEPVSKYHACFKLASSYISQGKFGEAERTIKQAIAAAEEIGDEGQKMWSHSYLAQVHLASGKPKDALQEWETATGIATKQNLDWPVGLHLKGLIYLDMKLVDKAQETGDKLKQTLEKRKNKKLMRYYYHLMGEIELKRQNLPESIEYLRKALSLLPFQHSQLDDHAMFLFPLASAYYNAGRLKEAQEEYKKITLLTSGRLFYGDVFAKSFCMLGRICQETGQEQEAVQYYARFIELWQNADPGIVELEDARERLKHLRLRHGQLTDGGG